MKLGYVRFIAAALLGICGICQPISGARAGDGLLFVDSSASVKSFADVFRISMRDLASTARGGYATHRQKLHFAPIAEGSIDSSVMVLANSGMRDEELRVALRGQFSFAAQETHLAKSLKAAAAIGNVSHIMILSDMEPDHLAGGGRWAFSRQDMDDLLETEKVLRSYLSRPTVEKLSIVLLDWSQSPEAMLEGGDRANPRNVVARARRTNNSQLSRNSPASDEDETNTKLYKMAAAAVIVGLQKEFGSKLLVQIMPQRVAGNQNETQLFRAACSVFAASLGADPRCQGSAVACDSEQERQIRSRFKVAVDAGPYANDPLLLKVLRQQFAQPLTGAGLAMPREIEIVQAGGQGGGRGTAASGADFRVVVCPRSLEPGPLRCGGRFAPPDPKRMAWQLFTSRGANSDRREVAVNAMQRVASSGRQPEQAARLNLADNLRGALRSEIRARFAPPERQLWLVLKRPGGDPMPWGQRIKATYSLGGETHTTESRVREGTGSVILPVPSGANNVRLYHFSRNSGTGSNTRTASSDLGLPIGTVPDKAVRSCAVQNVVVPESLFVPKDVKVIWPASRIPATARKARLQVRLDDGLYDQHVANPEISGPAKIQLRLPPGRYLIGLFVEDPRLVMPDDKGPTWTKSDAEAALRTAADGFAASVRGDIEIQVDADPLLVERPGNAGDSDRIDRLPNYLAANDKVWQEVNSWFSNGQLTPAGQRKIMNSANSLWGVLALASEHIDQAAAGTAVRLPATQLKPVLTSIKQFLSSAATDRAKSRLLVRTISRIGLIDAQGRQLDQASDLLQLLMHRLADGNLCASATLGQAAARSYDRQLVDGYNSWLIQSTIEPQFRAGDASPRAQGRMGVEQGWKSHTPFTQEMVRRCLISEAPSSVSSNSNTTPQGRRSTR